MESSLLDVLFLSEKRKNLLLLLLDGPKNIEEIKNTLDVRSSPIMTQIKILMKQDLVVESDRLYKLSSIGEILVPKMKVILETFNVFDKNHDYWINQDMTSIPPEFLDEIGKLGDYMEVKPDRNHVFEYPKEVVKQLSESEKVRISSSFFLPIYPSLCIDLAAKGTDITLVFTEYVYDRMLNDYKKELEHFLNLKHTKLYVCNNNNMKIASSIVTEKFMSLSLFCNSGIYYNHNLVSFDEGALRWGRELFDHYKNIARPITRL
ncbi:MAG TPA: winged helix-turn-helix domain-containing protein [Methanosarcina sp.]|jgi:predicted transcriptional regulator